MIKPIVYHSFEEKEVLERELNASIPFKKRLHMSKTLMDIFYNASRRNSLKGNLSNK
jgi:hypothetical protein